ncbi:RepB family DNA primase [Aliiroseovarius sp. M344]|uniref:RepB family DNA primase n=1 Tax=Aliiroseovarius sp. M344 TaxID=2867010 RepID=UPI0021ADBA96|nr:RepB family DNA primase [Aliiroseovarius sp. M344]UWQ13080.1 RepB family DNA primase [Aliiroseovarius sp. M344]
METHTYEAAPLIAQMPHFVDRISFLTLNRFWYGRKLKSLASLNALYVDLDYFHAPQWRGKPPAEVQSAFTAHLLISGMPQPSVFLQTGRGLAAIWLIEPIPVSALPRWQGAMGALIDVAAAFGADKACKDAARVFRIPGTLNEKSQKEVRVSGGTAERHRFDDLADQIYRAAGRPTRAELQERRTRKSKKRRANAAMPRGLTQTERFRLIRDDLAAFRDAHGGLIPTGLRNTWLHFHATCLTHLPEVMDLEAEILRAAQGATPGLERIEVNAIVRQAIQKAKLFTNASLWADGRYHYKGATMAERLGITSDLARNLGLKQVIPEEERRRRKAEAERQRRAANGAKSRDAYLEANSASRKKPWAALGIGRTKYYELKRVGMLPEPLAA